MEMMRLMMPLAASAFVSYAICMTESPSQVPKSKTEKIDAQVSTKWKEAGAIVGWYVCDKDRDWISRLQAPLDIETFDFGESTPGGKALPGLIFPKYKAGTISALPAPKQPFSLGVRDIENSKGLIDGLINLKELHSLHLETNHLAKSEFKKLAALTALKYLDISGTDISDNDMDEIMTISQLVYLGARDTKISDSGLKNVRKLKQLVTLDICRTLVSDAGLESVGHCQHLIQLNLFSTKITDAGLKHIAS